MRRFEHTTEFLQMKQLLRHVLMSLLQVWNVLPLPASLPVPRGLRYRVIKQQSWMMLSSTKTPLCSSVSTGRPPWYQCTWVLLSTQVAVHWKGKRSPWNTTCLCDGISSKRGSSRGPAAGKTKQKQESKVTINCSMNIGK